MQDFPSHYSDSVDCNECKNTLEKTHIEENTDELFNDKNDFCDTQQLQQDSDQNCSKECELSEKYNKKLISEKFRINESQTQSNEQLEFHTIIDEQNESSTKNDEQQEIQAQNSEQNEIQTQIDEQQEIKTRIYEHYEIHKIEQQEIQTQIGKQNDEQVDESSTVQKNFKFKDQIIQ